MPQYQRILCRRWERGWIVFGGAGHYYTGDFDGYKFEWCGKNQSLFHGEDKDIGRKYHGSAGLPGELVEVNYWQVS